MGDTPVHPRGGWWRMASGLTAILAALAVLVVFTLHALPTVVTGAGNAALSSTSLGQAQTEPDEPHMGSTSADNLSAQPAGDWQLAGRPAPVVTACSPALAGVAAPQAITVAQPQAGAAQVSSTGAAPSVTLVRYTVRTGDTLFGLARRFGTTVEAIIAANNLPSCTIFICQELLIPVQACAEGCASVPVPVASAPVVSAPACPAACPSVSAPTCPAVCPCVAAPACPTVVRAAVVAPICPSALPTPLPIPIRPGASQPILVAHVVQPGEDIFHIAIRYQVNVAVLMQVNYLSAAAVKVGQTLLIP